MKNYKLSFSSTFVDTVDSILKEDYSNQFTPREAFFKLFELINKFSSYTEDRKSASIHWSVIRDFLGKKQINKKREWLAAKVIEVAVNKNIISFINHRYDSKNLSNNKSRVYSYTEIFKKKYTDKISHIDIDKTTQKKMEKEYKRPTQKLLRIQYDILNKASFDYKGASNWINSRANDLTDTQLANYNSSALRMFNKQINITQDPKTNRIFSNLTLMKKELRQFITIDGESLAEVDLKSSQPFLLAHMILREEPQNNEFKAFLEMVTTKDIYNHFRELWYDINGSYKYFEYNVETEVMDEREITNRDVSKREFMRLLFKGAQGSVPFQVVLKHSYPKVYLKLQELKKRFKGIDNNLAIQLQKVEADLFLPLMIQIKDCITCHDSVYIKVSEAIKVKEIVSNHLNNNKYFKATIKYKEI